VIDPLAISFSETYLVKKNTNRERMDENTTNKNQILSRKKLKELLEQVDPDERLDGEVESTLLELADDFIVNVTKYGCQMARHRQSDTLEVKDLQAVLGIH
jgi:transcription initiation factor TFIID subunit TAF12